MRPISSLRAVLSCAILAIALAGGCSSGHQTPPDEEIPPPPQKSQLRGMEAGGEAQVEK